MTGDIAFIVGGLLLFAIGTFIRGCVMYIGHEPRHMLPLIDREALVHYAIRYSFNRTAFLLGILLMLDLMLDLVSR